MKKSNIAFLLLVPTLVLIFNLFLVRNEGKFYFNWTDPSYAYLFNGMNIANGKMVVGHIDNPGTTVQTANGILTRIIYEISGTEKDLSSDVISNPEKYLSLISWIYILINCSLLFFCGLKIYRVGKNIATALFLQSGTIVFFYNAVAISNPAPETFLVAGILLLTTVCFSFIHENEISTKKMLKYAVKFGLISAFLIVTKITSLPLLILPFFLLRRWKSSFLYAISLVVFAFVFLIPAWSKLNYFLQWINKLIFHAGIYGTGAEKIVDAEIFKQGLYCIFTEEIIFAIILALEFFTIVFLVFSKRFTLLSWKGDPKVRLLVGLFFCTLLCVIIVAKHFSFHYLIPGYAIMMLGGYLSLQFIFSSAGKISSLFSKPIFAVSILVCFIICEGINDYSKYYFFPNHSNPRINTAIEMEKYGDLPRLYVTYEFYSPEISPALYFGLCYSGEIREKYIPILEKKYPLSYFYSYPENLFHDWRNSLQWTNIVSKNKKMLISFYYTNPDVVSETLNLLNQINVNGHFEIKKIYENAVNGDQLYIMNCMGTIDTTMDSLRVIKCDAENVARESLISTDGKYDFQGRELLTDKFSHSGKNSLQLTPDNPYGFGFHLLLNKTRHYEISAWRKSDNGKGAVVASGPDFSASSVPTGEKTADGWEKISLKFQVPQTYAESSIKIFVWNESGDQPIYFDDFTIVEY